MLNVKTDKEVKEKARETAHSLGMSLSAIINAYLAQFIRTEEVHFYLGGELKPSVKKRLNKLQKKHWRVRICPRRLRTRKRRSSTLIREIKNAN